MKKNANEPVYYMNQAGYDQFLSRIEEKRKQLSRVCSIPCDGSSFSNSANDTELDEGFALKADAMRTIKGELEKMVAKLPYITIVEKHNNEQLVDIDDIVLVSYNNSSEEKEAIIRLVGCDPDIFAEISQVSLNSPIGKAIFGQPIGSTVNYTVGKNQFSLVIVEKLNRKFTR